jgi:hypothetical protein
MVIQKRWESNLNDDVDDVINYNWVIFIDLKDNNMIVIWFIIEYRGVIINHYTLSAME